MPKMDGFSFLRALRGREPPVRSIPALMNQHRGRRRRPRGRTRGGRQLLLGEAAVGGRAGRTRPCARRHPGGTATVNELLEQFLVETRELVQSATDDLLALEVSPGDAEAVNGVFRAFHTSRAQSGCSTTRHGSPSCTRPRTACRRRGPGRWTSTPPWSTCRWRRWMRTGALGRCRRGDGTPCRCRRVRGRRLVRAVSVTRLAGSSGPGDEAVAIPKWVDRLVATSDYAVGAAIAVRYEPRADCFFSGDDPLGLVRKVPGLRAVKVETVAPWPPEEEIDVYACNLVVMLLASAPRGDVEAVFRLVGDQVALVEVPAAIGPAAGRGLPRRRDRSLIPSSPPCWPNRSGCSPLRPTPQLRPGASRRARGRRRTRCAQRGGDRDAELCERAAGRDAEAVAAAISSILSEPLQAISKASVPPPAGEEAGETIAAGPVAGRRHVTVAEGRRRPGRRARRRRRRTRRGPQRTRPPCGPGRGRRGRRVPREGDPRGGRHHRRASRPHSIAARSRSWLTPLSRCSGASHGRSARPRAARQGGRA